MLAATAEPLPQETAAAGAVWLTREQVESDLGQVTTALTTRFAHFARSTPDYARHVSAIRSSASQGLSRDAFGLALTRLLALFQDSHAVVRGYDFPPGSLPFGIEPVGDRFVAHSRDRADFLAPNHPYLSKIDGRPLDDFLLAATRYVARGSISYRKVQISAILGRLNLLRADLGLEIGSTADVTVQSESGSEVTIRIWFRRMLRPRFGRRPPPPSSRAGLFTCGSRRWTRPRQPRSKPSCRRWPHRPGVR